MSPDRVVSRVKRSSIVCIIEHGRFLHAYRELQRRSLAAARSIDAAQCSRSSDGSGRRRLSAAWRRHAAMQRISERLSSSRVYTIKEADGLRAPLFVSPPPQLRARSALHETMRRLLHAKDGHRRRLRRLHRRRRHRCRRCRHRARACPRKFHHLFKT